MIVASSSLAGNELADGPVLVRAIGEISPDDQWNLLGCELLHGDFERVGLAFGWH